MRACGESWSRGEVVLRGYDYKVNRHFVEHCEACYFSSLFQGLPL